MPLKSVVNPVDGPASPLPPLVTGTPVVVSTLLRTVCRAALHALQYVPPAEVHARTRNWYRPSVVRLPAVYDAEVPPVLMTVGAPLLNVSSTS